MKKILVLALAVLLAGGVLLVGCSGGARDTAGTEADESSFIGNQLIADFTTTTIYGDEVTMTDLFAGYDVIMLNFWGTFCSPCIEEMPYIGELAIEYADKNVLVVGVVTDLLDTNGNVDETVLADGKHIVETTGANYTHLVPCDGIMPLMQQIYAVPTTVFLNAEGYQLGGAQIGALDKDGWYALLDSLLARLTEETT